MKFAEKIKTPQTLNPKILLWADVCHDDMKGIDNIKSIPELERLLCCVLGVDLPEPRRGVLLELYVHTVLFCRRNIYNREQTSALLSIVKRMHQANTETPLNDMDRCFAYCSELLLCHSVKRPPFSIGLFGSEEVTRILKHLLNTYFRHYNLYKYIFTPQVRLDLSFTYSGMPGEDSVTEDAGSSDGEHEEGKETNSAEGEQPTEAANPPPELVKTEPSPKSDLRTIVQQEMSQEIMRMSSQLQQRLKESADQLNSALTLLETNLQGKK